MIQGSLYEYSVQFFRIEEPPKVLKKDDQEEKEKEEGFNSLNPFKNILPSFFYSNQVYL